MIARHDNDPNKGRIQDITKEGTDLCRLADAAEMEAVLHAIDREGYPVDARGINNHTALLHASRKGNLPLMHALLERGADANAADIDGKSCLHHTIAARPANADAVLAALLDAGADMQAQDRRRGTPQDKARQLNNRIALDTLGQYADMPALPVMETLDKAALYARNAGGKCLLDAPATWHRWPEVANALEQQGEYLSKFDLFAEPEQGGASPMERAVQCHAFGAVMRQLWRQGEVLEMADLLPDGQHPAPWVEQLGKTHQLAQLFNKEIWQDKGTEALQDFRRALDVEDFRQVGNYHQLKTAISVHNQQQGAGR